MFELETPTAASETNSRRTLFLILAATFVVVSAVVGLVMWWEKQGRETAAVKMSEGMLRAGNPEYDDYLQREGVRLVTLDRLVVNGEASDRYEYICRIENRGNRPLTGIELRVYLIDMEENHRGEAGLSTCRPKSETACARPVHHGPSDADRCQNTGK